MKMILFCSDQISLNSGYLTGGGLRSLQLLKFFSSSFDVIPVVPRSDKLRDSEFDTYEITVQSQLALMDKHDVAFAYFVNANACMIGGIDHIKYGVDLHGPIFMESAFVKATTFIEELSIFHSVLSRASIITCVSFEQIQALNFIGAGYSTENFFCKNIYCLPLTFGDHETLYSDQDSRVLGYYGSIYPWIEPFEYLNSFANGLEDHFELNICAAPHLGLRNYHVVNKSLLDLALKKKVKVFGLVPRSDLDDFLNKTFAVIDLSDYSPERSICVSTRSIEYIGLGIPVIVNDYSFFGRLFSAAGLTELVISNYQDVPDLLRKIKSYDLDKRKEISIKQRLIYQEYFQKHQENEQIKQKIEKLIKELGC